jgi:hypothetical protein
VGKITAIHCLPRTKHRPAEPHRRIHKLHSLLLPLAFWISKWNDRGKRPFHRRVTRISVLAIVNWDQMSSIRVMGTGRSSLHKSLQRMRGYEL